ncbi:unnamed protein product, partial [Arabidopsis halleri]
HRGFSESSDLVVGVFILVDLKSISLRRLLPTRILHSFHWLTSSSMRSISITRSPKQRSLYSRSAPTARNVFSSVFFASPVNRRRCYVSMSPSRVRDKTLIVVGQSLSWETFSASIPHWRSKFLMYLLMMRSLVELINSLFSLVITYTSSSLYHRRRELIDLQLPTHLITNLSVESRIFSGVLRRSLPPCTTAKLSSASSAGSAASPKYRFSSFKSVAAIFNGYLYRLDSNFAPTTLFFGSDLLSVIKRPCSKIWMLLSCDFENPVSKNRDNKRNRILWCETNHVLHLGNHSLLRPVAFGCNKSVFKFGKMNQGGQGMIGILTLDLSFPDSINSSLEERHGFNFLFVERETSSASISHTRGKLLMCLLLRSLVEFQNTMLSMVIPFTRRGGFLYPFTSFILTGTNLPCISLLGSRILPTIDSPPHLRESFLRGGTPYQ